MADEGAPPGRRGLTRKQALAGAGAVAVAGGAAAAIVVAIGDDDDGGEAQGYPRRKVARKGDLKPNEPVTFEYPRKGQQSVLIDLGQEVPGGVGDDSSIVAYSSLCQHMGCPVGYVAAKRHFHCGCHQTRYDPARDGAVIQGVAQRPLPRIALEVDGDDIVATGVNGLIYGYRNNVESAGKAA
jgi:arsenite oxidase small subunit